MTWMARKRRGLTAGGRLEVRLSIGQPRLRPPPVHLPSPPNSIDADTWDTDDTSCWL